MTKLPQICKRILTISLSALFFLGLTSSITAASFSFENLPAPASDTCERSTYLMIDPASETSNSADIIITYDPSAISVGQIEDGEAFETYGGNIVDNSIGFIKLTGVSTNSLVTSKQIFARIDYEVLDIERADFEIEFTGAGETLDSNIAAGDTNNDILTSVGVYSLLTNGCQAVAPPELPDTGGDGASTDTPPTPVEPEEPYKPSLPDQIRKYEPTLRITSSDIFPNWLKPALNAITFSGFIALSMLIGLMLMNFSLVFAPLELFHLILSLLAYGRKSWGIVIDSKSHNPVADAMVKLFELKSKKLLAISITNEKGEFHFPDSKGKFKVYVNHSDYEPKVITREGSSDGITSTNIAIDKVDNSELFDYGRWLKNGLILLGLILSIIAFIISTNILNGFILMIYICIIILKLVFFWRIY